MPDADGATQTGTDVMTEGKTKRIVRGPRPGTVRLEAIDRLTGGDAARSADIAAIGRAKTAQAANCFALLAARGIPTAFVERADETTLLCRDCDMLPLEFVVRRYAFGSFLKRRPDMRATPPRRFDEPLYEIFHKHSVVMPPHVDEPRQMEEGGARRHYLRNGEWADGVLTDPYIETGADTWALYSAKAPVEGEPLMRIAPTMDEADLARALDDIVRPAFAALEEAWAGVETEAGPVRLVDIKLELGRDRETGELLLADVVDNDSWRVWPGGDPARRLDKQAFRDGAPEAEVSANYDLVARLTGRFAA